MALSRITTWVAGNVLTAAALNGEFNNFISNPIALISPSTGPINFALYPHTNFVIENVGADPTAATTGRIIYNTVRKQLEIDDGQFIRAVPTVLATGISNNSVVLGSTSNSFGLGSIAALAQGSRVQGLTASSTTPGSASSWAIGGYALLQTTDATASFLFRSTAAFSVDVNTATTAATAGARDQASTFSSTGQWAHFYLITTGVGSTTPAGVASLTAPPTGPAMPSSYSAWAYLNSMYYTTGSAMQAMAIRGSRAFYTQSGSTAAQLVTSSATRAAGNPANSATYSTQVPPNSLDWLLQFCIDTVGASEPFFIWNGSTNDSPYHRINNVNTVYAPDLTLEMPTMASGSFNYGLTGTARTVIASVANYRVPNGDA